MRGSKAALVARALAQRVGVPALVRGAVARELGLLSERAVQRVEALCGEASSVANAKLSIRMKPYETRQLAAGACNAGVSRGVYLAGHIANVPVLSVGASRPDHIAVLIASSAELSTSAPHMLALLRFEFCPATESLTSAVESCRVLYQA